MEDALAAFGLVFLAELGDKSMLLAVGFAARHRALPVLAGIAFAAVTAIGFSVALGTALGAVIPRSALAIVGGVVFLAFGVWTLRGDDDEEDAAELRGRFLLIGVSLAFLVAELGDKTMIASVALAGVRSAVPVWIGGALGMTVASGIAIGIAASFGSRLPERAVRVMAAAAFLFFGVVFLVDGLRGAT